MQPLVQQLVKIDTPLTVACVFPPHDVSIFSWAWGAVCNQVNASRNWARNNK